MNSSVKPDVYLSELVGLKCWVASLVNGEELQLEFGERVPVPEARHSGLTVGQFTLIIASPAWSIDGVDREQLVSDDLALTMALRKLEDEVRRVDVRDQTWVLRLEFSKKTILDVRPRTDGIELPDWEFFLDDDRVLVAGPNGNLTFQSKQD